MTHSKLRIRTNRIKLLLAAAFIIFLRRTLLFVALVSLAAFLLSQGNNMAAAAKPEEIRFSDIKGHWAEIPIMEAASGGIVSGYEDGTFKPDGNVRGRAFLVMLTAALHIPHVAASPEQSDGGPALDPYMASLLDAGILSESDLSAAAMDRELNRSDMIKFAVNALDPEAAGERPDIILMKAEAAGLIDSGQEQRVSMEKTATRAEAVVVLQRLQRLLGLQA